MLTLFESDPLSCHCEERSDVAIPPNRHASCNIAQGITPLCAPVRNDIFLTKVFQIVSGLRRIAVDFRLQRFQ